MKPFTRENLRERCWSCLAGVFREGSGKAPFSKNGRLLAPLLALYVSYNQRQRRRRSRQNSVSSSCESQTLAASVYGGQQSSIEPAAASGCWHCRPAIRKESCGFAEFANSKLWFPNSSIGYAATNGRRHCRPAAGRTGHCPARSFRNSCGALPRVFRPRRIWRL